MPSLAAGTEAGELSGHVAPAALRDPPAPAFQRAESQLRVRPHHVGGVRTASPRGSTSEPFSLFSEAGGTRRDGRSPACTPGGPRPWLSEAAGPGLAAHSSVPTRDARSSLRAHGTFWEVDLEFGNGSSVSKTVMGSPPLGSESSFLTEGAAGARLAPSPSWASSLVSECPEPTSLSSAPRASLWRAPACLSGSCLALPARQSPSPLLYGIFQKELAVKATVKKKRMNLEDFQWSPRGRRRAGGLATAPVQLKPATLEVQAEPWSLAAVETARSFWGSSDLQVPAALCASSQEGTYRQLRGVGLQSPTGKTQPLIQQRYSEEVGRCPARTMPSPRSCLSIDYEKETNEPGRFPMVTQGAESRLTRVPGRVA